MFFIVESSSKMTHYFHNTGYALIFIVPVSFAISPSIFNLPLDLALGFMFPLHSFIGCNYVISDYVPKALRGPMRMFVLGATVITLAGLLRLNITGGGITNAIKSMWADPPKKSKKTAEH